MVAKQILRQYVLSQLSLKYNPGKFLRYLRLEVVDFDLSIKKLKLYSFFGDSSLDIDTIKTILSKKLNCNKEDLSLSISRNFSDCQTNFNRELIIKKGVIDHDHKIEVEKLIERQIGDYCEFSELNLFKLKYNFLKDVSIVEGINLDFPQYSKGFFIKVGSHIFNGFDSLFAQLKLDDTKYDIVKKYKAGILLIGSVCLCLTLKPSGSPIYVSEVMKYYNDFKNGKNGEEWKLTSRGVGKNTITETDCSSARMVFLKCGLKHYKITIKNGILEISFNN